MSLPKPPDNLSSVWLRVLRTAIGASLVAALVAATVSFGRDTPPSVPPPVGTLSPPSAPVASPPPEEPKAPVVYQSRGRRDPFLQPVVESGQQEPLVHLKLTGIVWGPRSHYALVESGSVSGMGYVIREHDVVDSAKVIQITKDTVIFEVTSRSAAGKPLTRYVQKHLPVESR